MVQDAGELMPYGRRLITQPLAGMDNAALRRHKIFMENVIRRGTLLCKSFDWEDQRHPKQHRLELLFFVVHHN